MEPELIASYKSAEAVARSRSNFYYSFIVLPPEKRRAFCAVYAFMRYCDDISDGAGSNEAKCAMLRDWRSQLDAVFAGTLPNNAILPAFRDTVNKFLDSGGIFSLDHRRRRNGLEHFPIRNLRGSLQVLLQCRIRGGTCLPADFRLRRDRAQKNTPNNAASPFSSRIF